MRRRDAAPMVIPILNNESMETKVSQSTNLSRGKGPVRPTHALHGTFQGTGGALPKYDYMPYKIAFAH
jgi:hypothetical protein